MCNRAQQPLKWVVALGNRGLSDHLLPHRGNLTRLLLGASLAWLVLVVLKAKALHHCWSLRLGLVIWESTAELASSGQLLLLSRGWKKRGVGLAQVLSRTACHLGGRQGTRPC